MKNTIEIFNAITKISVTSFAPESAFLASRQPGKARDKLNRPKQREEYRKDK
jgi:hypothetical protein